MNKFRTIRTTTLIALMILAISLAACAQPASPTPAPTAVPTKASTVTPVPPTAVPPTAVPTAPAKAVAALTLDMLQNAEYASEFTASKKAKLVGGKYEESAAPGSASKVLVTLITTTLAFGDLNGDGVDDAAVILATNSGGSGTFITLNAVLNDKGAAKFASAVSLGDRVQPKTITISGGIITVDEIRHSPTDPLCCPTQAATLQFKLVDGKLVEAAPLVVAVPTAPAKVAAAPLTMDLLQNAEYASEFTASKKAKLAAGKYEESAAPGSASKVTVTLLAFPMAFGDLNGDGVDDAAVLLTTNSGGSGTFVVLNVVLNDKGAAKFASAVLLGDRVQPKTITIAGGVITVDEIRHSPTDPLCCPTQQATLKFKLVDGKLTEIK
jgi:hypothetical protein